MFKYSRMRFRLFIAWKITHFKHTLVFLPIFVFWLFFSVGACFISITSGGCNQSSFVFLCNFLVVVSIHWYYRQCWCVLFLLFLTHIVILHFLDIRPYSSSWVFLFSNPFIKVLLTSTLRIVPSILREGQSRYLSVWWKFCYVLWFRVVFRFPGVFFYFSFIYECLVMFASIIPKYLEVSFSPSVLVFSWFVYFYSFRYLLFPAFHFEHGTFFLPNSIPISSLYIFTACIYVSNSFLFLAPLTVFPLADAFSLEFEW